MNIAKTLRAAVASAALIFAASAAQAKDIVDIALGSDQHKTLVAALQAAGLVETLQSKGPFTVFAPTDAAFAELPQGTLETLLKPENKDQLVSILTYHVLPGAVYADDIASKQVVARTVQGQSVLASGVSRGVIFVSNGANNNSSEKAKVVAQIPAGNGVVHVIDKVLLPN